MTLADTLDSMAQMFLNEGSHNEGAVFFGMASTLFTALTF